MESRENKDFDLYKDIQGRTGGEIYIGVVAGAHRKINVYQTVHGFVCASLYH